MALPADTPLNNRYTLRRTLRDAEGFATTYLAYDEQEEQEVVVTEYFPAHLAERAEDGLTVHPTGDGEAFRQGLKYFRKEAKQLREIDHPNLVREREDFDANGTAYRVSEHRAGASLATALEKNDGSVSEPAALTVMKPVLGALHALHRQGLVHGGLSPEAIYLTKSRKVLLRGVRGAQLQLARKTDALDAVVIPGMSPAEQYDADGRQGPWTDVYAAAAAFYRAVTGRALPEAHPEPLSEEIVAQHLDEADELSQSVKHILKRGLAPRPRGRMQSAQAFRELLDDPSKQVPGMENAAAPAESAGVAAAGTAAAGPAASGGDAGGLGEMEAWGPASMAAAAAEAVKKDKEKSHGRRKAAQEKRRQDRTANPSGGEEQKARALPFSNRIAMGAGATVLALLLAGAGFLFLRGGESNAESSTSASYTSLVAEGDSLYKNADYQGAASRYEEAQKLNPEATGTDGERVTERLLTIDRMRDAIAKENYQRAMDRGNELKTRADALAEEGQEEEAKTFYARASASYLVALDHRPADSVASARVQAANEMLDGGGKESERKRGEEFALCAICGKRHEPGLHQRVAGFYRQQGESAFEEENYQEAQRKFREVLTHSPDDEQATERLKEIGTLLSAADREEQYRRYRQQASTLFDQGRLAEARREYELALEAKPGDAAVTKRLSAIDQRQQQQRDRQEQYQYHRSRGDVRFEEDRLEEAVESYQRALEYRSDDSYAQQRISEAQKKMTESEEKEKAEKKANRTENGIYTVVDEQPKIVGGQSALYDKISYPPRAQRRGIEGRVFLKTTVGADGAVQDVEVLRGIGYGTEEEAQRAVRSTKFIPATLDGKPVAAFRTVMVQFQLSN